MDDIALFRYHRDLEVCKNRLQFFSRFNPGIKIHGLFGGDKSKFDKFTRELDLLSSNHLITDVPEEWKWKDFDFVLKKWYAEKGNQLEFRNLYLLEWDFILYGSVEKAYKEYPVDHVIFTGLRPLREIESKWYWTIHPPKKKEYEKLKTFLQEKHGFAKQLYGCMCPGLRVSKTFLDSMQEIDLPDYGNDELRFPIYAQLAGIDFSGNDFFKRWFSKRESKYFNCNSKEIKPKTIHKQLKKKRGRRAFHPVRSVIEP
jgi:hypothetical protein